MKSAFEDSLGALLGTSLKALRNGLTRNLSEAGCELATHQLLLLNIIEAHEGVNQQTFTEFMAHDKTAITRGIDFLESRQLVVRIPDEADRRQNRIFLTDEGRKTIAKWAPVILRTEHEALKGVSAQNIKVLKDVLLKVRENLPE